MLEDILDFDVATLAASIDESAPAGQDLRLDTSPMSLYFGLKDVRNEARAAERKAMVENEPLLSFANLWDRIIEQVPQVLLEQSKDLELAAWLIEALARRFGFKGLALGFEIAHALVDAHWQHLYPMPDEDGMSTRVAPLNGLNGFEGDGTLLMPIASIPLTENYEDQAYCLWEFEQAGEVERLDEDKRAQRYAAGAVRLEHVTAAVNASAPSFFVGMVHDIEHAITAYTALTQAIDSAMEESQPSSHINKRLTACLDAVRYLAADKLAYAASMQSSNVQISEQKADSEGDKASPACASSMRFDSSSYLHSRAEAITQLQVIASYFKQTEPHSPIAYGIEQVVRWSRMPLPELLQELIADTDARAGFFRRAGILSEHKE